MIGWIDARAGVSEDMLLGALVDVGVQLDVLQTAVDRLDLGITLTSTPCERGGIGATRVDVGAGENPPIRYLPEIQRLLDRVEEPVRTTAGVIFRRLAEAQSCVYRIPLERVDFHEVGVRDTLAYVVGAAAGFHRLGLKSLHCSQITVGSGTAHGAHGRLPLPAPSVLELLRGVPVAAGPVMMECATPTGAAVLATLVTDWGEMPPLVLLRVGCGAGQRNPTEVANVLRLVVGEPVDQPTHTVLLETNVDDLDPRVWPYVIERLLAAGAHDAWLTPIIMKKGRPAHTLSVLVSCDRAADLRAIIFRETSTIGMRESTVTKHHRLARSESLVHVGGQPIRIKTARLDGETVNVNPEWRDVVAAAQALGQPAKQVLAEARRAASDDSHGS
ncbi:nickel pincer cofactor biosynthesis protein LarC [Mycobacterium decipiens]|uniref:Pyridinium-3,5-bisthiocarboxylic acid mononucleotide nickel insertion protein n=1 Tax=Mycobacterium decipiens TaxID=1430326 RepID=A0A1X2LRK4_9MYCO|nr:nickel pincer cofactor biosynthesis protein LarC [Mycobacterium decipiens]OSC38399.1 TIGR00299 family protein [Mycobacterium decipiens]